MTLDCIGCCSACKPPWIRLVDNIYPSNIQDGLVKNNMAKLTFYALSNPQKLDRIGEYLSKRLSRDLIRNRINCVRIAMEAMDTLLVACHAQSLNLFVESFLRMVQKLLECSDPDMQCLATNSFVKFSNIEEDTPSYHRRYDFFVSQFSAMCHSNHATAKHSIRAAGLQGLQGVIRKTVCDELQPDIWEQHHMDKIVPSLLYNMHCNQELPQDMESSGETSASNAEKVFRDLVCRAAFNNLKSVLRPVLLHMDSHNLWCKTNFPSSCFKIIMYSVQAQYSHVVVQMLMSHLDNHSKSGAALKAEITDVLSQTVIISAGGSIGPSVLEVFNSLLRHLRVSVEYNSTSSGEQAANSRFQESIVNTIGEFANHLPDFQKIEILMFVMSKMPPVPSSHRVEQPTSTLLQTILLKTVLKVATTYRTVLMSNAFPSSLKSPLLQKSLVTEPTTRLVVQHILQTLIDRHSNASKLSQIWIPEDISELDLSVEKPSRQDTYFMKHSGTGILWYLAENFKLENNGLENLEALYATACLLMIELLSEETHVEFASFILHLQEIAASEDKLSASYRNHIHSIVLSLANIYGELSELSGIQTYINEVLQTVRESHPQALPEKAIYAAADDYDSETSIPSAFLLDTNSLKEILSSNGLDVSLLSKPLTTPDSLDNVLSSRESDMGSVSNLELESLESSPAMRRSSIATLPTADRLTFDQIKTLLESDEDRMVAERARKQQILEEFQTAPLETIMNRANSRNELNDRLFELLGESEDGGDESVRPVAIENIKYPAMFVY